MHPRGKSRIHWASWRDMGSVTQAAGSHSSPRRCSGGRGVLRGEELATMDTRFWGEHGLSAGTAGMGRGEGDASRSHPVSVRRNIGLTASDTPVHHLSICQYLKRTQVSLLYERLGTRSWAVLHQPPEGRFRSCGDVWATASSAGSAAHPETEKQWGNSPLGPSEKPPIVTQQFWQCILNTFNPAVNLRNKYLSLTTHRATQTLEIHPPNSVECYAKTHRLDQG